MNADLERSEHNDEKFYEIFEQTEKESLLEDIDVASISKDDIITGKEIYNVILTLPDEICINNYVVQLRQRAKELRCKSDFEQRVKAYTNAAFKQLKKKEREARLIEFEEKIANYPGWWDGRTIDEDIFCDKFLKGKDLRCINRIMYSVDGIVEDGQLESEIYAIIKSFCKKDIAGRVKKILETLKVKCYSPPLAVDIHKIHVRNGTIILGDSGKSSCRFVPEKEFCTSRLAVDYSENHVRPNVWLDFLHELLDAEDIKTLQEYMGYCLIPCTKAQRMLMLIGNGGEGKSRIGIVMQAIFGSALVNGEIKDLDNGSKARFAREKLVSRLVLLDDDVDLSALSGTSFLKQLVTAEIPLEVEPKGKPSFQAMLYSRVIAFGNGAISSLYDNSDGFYRRQIILKVKPKPDTRKDDSFLIDKLLKEKEQIFQWCLRGLWRLIDNDFTFTVSESAKRNLEESRREGCNIIAFMESEDLIKRDPYGAATAKELYWAYEKWCDQNNEESRRSKSFTRFLRDNQKRFNIVYGEHVAAQTGGRARGFKGIALKVGFRNT